MHNNANLYHLIQWHLAKHKNIAIQDVYKLLYQGVFGAEHLLSDAERAITILNEEWQRVPANKTEALFEPLSIDGNVVRANIRRCKAEEITVEQLWTIFYTSVTKVRATKSDFEKVWDGFVELCRLQHLPFQADDAHQFGIQAKSEGWPAKHHSAAYREANYPAYRVVLKDNFAKIADINLDAMSNNV